MPPGFEVTVYPVIGLPFDRGAVKPIVALPLPATAVTLVGALGELGSTKLLDAADAEPVPMAFVAVTVKV